MTTESIIIVIILVVVAYSLIRTKHTEWAKAVFPLLVVPIFNIFLPHHRLQSAANGPFIRAAIYTAGFLITAVLVGLWARKKPRGKNKIIYLICAVGFTLIFALILFFKGGSVS